VASIRRRVIPYCVRRPGSARTRWGIYSALLAALVRGRKRLARRNTRLRERQEKGEQGRKEKEEGKGLRGWEERKVVRHLSESGRGGPACRSFHNVISLHDVTAFIVDVCLSSQ